MSSKWDSLVFAYAVIIGVYLLLNITPGTLVTDEVAYTLMAHTLATEGRLDIWNGLNETVSWELLLPSMDYSTDGNVVKMYGTPAPLYTLIAYPFYKISGLNGLFALNILSYSSLIMIVYFIGRLFLDERLAAASALAYSLFTNSLSFTNTALPHLLSTALVCLSLLLVFRKLMDKGLNTAHFFVAGFAGGLSIGVRFTNVFFIFVLAFLIFRDSKREMLNSFATGLFIPLAAIALIDYISYGDVFETSYGNPVEWVKFKYLLLALPAVVGGWLLVKKKASIRATILLSAVLGVFVVWLFWDPLVVFATTLYARLFDLTLDPSIIKVEYKKALLQSSPFLILSVFFLAFPPVDYRRRLFSAMCVMSLLNIAFYATFSHGGADETLSMRYFMESIPLLVTLSVYGICAVFGRLGRQELVMASALFVAVVFLYVRDGNVLYSLDRTMRAIPAVVALMTLATCVLYVKMGRHRSLCLALVAVCLAISLSYCYADWALRLKYYREAGKIESMIRDTLPDGSAIFTGKRTQTGFMTLTQISKRVRVIDTEIDGRYDTPRLVDFYVNRGVPVYYYSINDFSPEWLVYFQNISDRYPPGSVRLIDVQGGIEL